MRILAVGAHPDDVEIGCSGTLALYSKSGAEVFTAHICTGDKGHKIIKPEELAKIRAAECEKAAKVIKAKIIHGHIGDGELEYNLTMRDAVVDIIREADPDIIITHTPEDYHADHKFVSQLIVDASFMASVPHIQTKLKATEKIAQIFFMEPNSGFNFQPTEYIDISEFFTMKLEMMKQHQSQLTWLKDHDNIDILDQIETTAKFRGYQCGVKYAEGFIRYINALRVVPKKVF
jgi:Uncharacterized proteins, LmbE homologs